MEIWNLVFSQFDADGKGHYERLARPNIDTGMGLERLACVCQNVDSLFDVDTVMNITHKVSELTGAHYGESYKRDVSLRVITDHIRSATFMICDGILPSNEGRGYVLRRLLRRAARHGKLLGVNEPFLYQVVDTVVHENEGQYPDLREKQSYITKVIRTEEENFAFTYEGELAFVDRTDPSGGAPVIREPVNVTFTSASATWEYTGDESDRYTIRLQELSLIHISEPTRRS